MRLVKLILGILFAAFVYFEAHGGLDDHITGTVWSVPALGLNSAAHLKGIAATLMGRSPIAPEPETIELTAAGKPGGPPLPTVTTLPPAPLPVPASARSGVSAPAPVVTAMPPAPGPANTQAAGQRTTKLNTIPPELAKLINPSLLTTDPSGAQTLSPEARTILQTIIAQARANPAAFRDLVGAQAAAQTTAAQTTPAQAPK